MKEDTVAAAVLAGGRGPNPVARAAGVAHKALAQVGGEAVVTRVAAALRQARLVDDIVVVTAAGSPVVGVLPTTVASTEAEGYTMLDTTEAGFAYHSAHDQLLVVTCDLPLLTGEAVDHFVAAALNTGAELCYSMVEAKRLTRIHPGVGRLTVHLKDGHYCGGNLVLIGRSFFEREGERINRAYASRKSGVHLAAMLGVGFIVRFLLRRLTVDDIAQRARELLHCEVAAICSPYPEVAFDLDRPEHIAAAEALMGH